MTEAFETNVHIDADPDHVFDHFIKPELMVKWMGEFARLQAVEDGIFSVDIDGVLIRGHYKTLQRPNLIEVAWGEAGNEQMPPGSTQLTILLEPTATGTRLTLKHAGLVPEELECHAYGWPHFLARLVIAAVGKDPGPYPWKAEA